MIHTNLVRLHAWHVAHVCSVPKLDSPETTLIFSKEATVMDNQDLT